MSLLQVYEGSTDSLEDLADSDSGYWWDSEVFARLMRDLCKAL